MDALIASAAAGAMAGALAKTVMAPIERVKLLLQLQSASNKHMKQIGTPYTSAFDTARRVYTEQGPLSFWRGNVSNIIRHTGATAVTFTMKDRVRCWFAWREVLDGGFKFSLTFPTPSSPAILSPVP